MGQVQTEVDCGFSDFGLEVTCLAEDTAHQRDEVFLDLVIRDISEVDGEGILDQFQENEIVLENRILESFLSQEEECPETNLWWVVVSINFTIHSVSSLWI